MMLCRFCKHNVCGNRQDTYVYVLTTTSAAFVAASLTMRRNGLTISALTLPPPKVGISIVSPPKAFVLACLA